MKYLGIDYGLKNVGIAISDEEGRMAFPKAVLDNDKKLIENILEIIKSEKIEGVVVGESVNFAGQPNTVMKKIVPFKETLEKETDLPIYFQKELFTSREADRIQGVSSKQIRKEDRKIKANVVYLCQNNLIGELYALNAATA